MAIQTKELTTFGFTRGVNLYENTNKKLTKFGLKIWQYKHKKTKFALQEGWQIMRVVFL